LVLGKRSDSKTYDLLVFSGRRVIALRREKLNVTIILRENMNYSTIVLEKYRNIERLIKITKQMSLKKNRHLTILAYLQKAKEALREGDTDRADSLTSSAQQILFEEIPWTKEFYLELAYTK
jgi:hypothetical protein